MLTASGSPLVSGASPDAAMDKTARVKVLRAFLLGTKPQAVGSEIELDRRLAVELASYNKVALIKSEPKPVAAPAADTAPAKGKKGA